MGLTTEQLIERRTRVGASDVAAILGVDPYANAHDKYLDKRGQLADWQGNDATRLGDDFEPVILKWASEKVGPLVVGEVFHAEGIPLSSSLDARIADTREPLDAKTAGLTGPLVGNWGPDGSDEIPAHYIVQLHAQMICTGADIAHLAALIGGRGFAHFKVKRNEALCTHIRSRVEWFWGLVEAGTPPPDCQPSKETIRLIRRIPKKVVDIDYALVEAWNESKARLKLSADEKDNAESAMLAALGDAEAATCSAGTLTYLEQTRKEHTVKASTYRVARFKPNKGE